MRIFGIMAADENWGIGYKGDLPWERVKEDMNFFRKKTMGHPIIMGRKTMESIGDKFPLEGRVNIVLSKTLEDPEDGSYFVEKNVIDAVRTARDRSGVDFENTEAYVIGGSEIFKEFVPMMSGLFVTIVKGDFKSDTFFNPFSNARLIEEVSSKTLRENGEYEIIYLDFRCDEIGHIYYLNKMDCIYLKDRDGLEKTIKYGEESVGKTPKDHDKVALRGIKGMTAPDILSERKRKGETNKDEISVKELKEYFQTPSVVNKYLDEYDNKTVFDIDESYFYNVGSTVENAVLVNDYELPEGYSEIDREEIRNILKKNKKLKDNKKKPKDHTYVGGKVSVRELKKYFGVNLVSYGTCGSPLKNTEVIYIATDNHFYLLGNFLVISREKLPYHDSEEISKDEILKSIVKDLHRNTYFADEIMDAYGLDELLDSNGSQIGRYDKIDLTENTIIKKYSDRYSCTVINRNDHIPENYFKLNRVDELMEKFLIEKWDGYSGQEVRTAPEENKEEETVEGKNPISPSYYESDKIKLRDVLDQNLSRVKDGALSFYLGNTWKYLWRWDRKENPIQDLNKAKKYIEFAVDRLKEINSEEKSTDNETPDRVPPVDIKDLWKMYR
jgi:dihydrofolate reductase